MNWKQKIEAQIAASDGLLLIETDVVQALLDVAVAAEKMTYDALIADAETWGGVKQALDKLQEVE